ncbi:hypothetical protein GIB67_000227 [Kingdonia uniflora]|uniref:Uncharacterized protein n=1 Tax=Kingdonia uniflora TaxID=39325 RepID=A0A7J7LHE1_9MAGN|nr:hypothetical protein GIB67_000227 [Kingdonia uniflora]
MIRNVNVYGNDDDEVEEVMIQIPKKRKGPMDAFILFQDDANNCPYNDPSTFKPPSYNDLRVKILKKKKKRPQIGNGLPKVYDGSTHIHDAELIYKMLKDVIEEVGEKNVFKTHFWKKIDPIVLKSFDECAEWLVPDDARDDIVLGTDMTYGVLEDAEDGFDDPPLTRTSRTNTASHCSQEVASSSRSTTRHLQDSSDDDDYDVDTTTVWVMEMMMALTRDPMRTFDFIILARCFYFGFFGFAHLG